MVRTISKDNMNITLPESFEAYIVFYDFAGNLLALKDGIHLGSVVTATEGGGTIDANITLSPTGYYVAPIASQMVHGQSCGISGSITGTQYIPTAAATISPNNVGTTTGTFVAPIASQLIHGQSCGVSGSVAGTQYIPTASNTLNGILTGTTTGNVVLPNASVVQLGQTFGSNNSVTGEYVSSGPDLNLSAITGPGGNSYICYSSDSTQNVIEGSAQNIAITGNETLLTVGTGSVFVAIISNPNLTILTINGGNGPYINSNPNLTSVIPTAVFNSLIVSGNGMLTAGLDALVNSIYTNSYLTSGMSLDISSNTGTISTVPTATISDLTGDSGAWTYGGVTTLDSGTTANAYYTNGTLYLWYAGLDVWDWVINNGVGTNGPAGNSTFPTDYYSHPSGNDGNGTYAPYGGTYTDTPTVAGALSMDGNQPGQYFKDSLVARGVTVTT